MYLERATRKRQQLLRWAEMDRGMDQETILGKRQKGDHAVPDIKKKQPKLVTTSLVEPLQSWSQAHVQYIDEVTHYFVHSVSTQVLEVRYFCYYVLLTVS